MVEIDFVNTPSMTGLTNTIKRLFPKETCVYIDSFTLKDKASVTIRIPVILESLEERKISFHLSNRFLNCCGPNVTIQKNKGEFNDVISINYHYNINSEFSFEIYSDGTIVIGDRSSKKDMLNFFFQFHEDDTCMSAGFLNETGSYEKIMVDSRTATAITSITGYIVKAHKHLWNKI